MFCNDRWDGVGRQRVSCKSFRPGTGNALCKARIWTNTGVTGTIRSGGANF